MQTADGPVAKLRPHQPPTIQSIHLPVYTAVSTCGLTYECLLARAHLRGDQVGPSLFRTRRQNGSIQPHKTATGVYVITTSALARRHNVDDGGFRLQRPE